ncbi:MAG TPA: 2Fe-2S iron-sulfur cluster binding domain-containing protein [Gammaproteobacteria bacterium]|nr:2Fe-2S iron-sulfur cluster binding domain-containing protein [Gammaproteobacteria bacterium]
MANMPNHIFNIQLKKNKRNFECSENDPILEGGLRHGLSMHYECSNGPCGTCVAKLIDGNVKQIQHHDFALTEDQKNQGEFLMCCNAPASDIVLELELIGNVKSIAIQIIETKVKKISFINDNLAIITLRTPRSKTLQFMAGQDVELSFKGDTSRYPLASCPCHGMELEFHIRNMPEDAFAAALFTKKIKTKSIIDLEGPKGIFVLKEASTRPMVFIAWDSGFAPIRSLVEHAFSLEMPNPVHFYWAYPADEQAPYLENHAKSWQVIMDDYTYTPIACKFDRSNKNDCQKLAKQIFKSLDLNIINQSDLYVSAPAEVLIFLGELLLENGLNESQLIASPI